MKKRILSVLLSIVTVLTLVAAPASAASLPTISSSKYISCYTLSTSGKAYAYTSSSLTTKTGGYITRSTDQCRILQISGNAVKVSYPVSSGRKTAWFYRSEFTSRNLASSGASGTTTASAKITTYRTAAGSTTYGYVSKGDKMYVLTTSGNRVQIIYPTGSTYKMAWINKSDFNNSTGAIVYSTVTEDTYFLTTALSTSMAMDVYGANTANGTNVQYYKLNTGKDNQKFKIVKVSGSWYKIVNATTGKAVTAAAAKKEANVYMSTYTGSNTQLWGFCDAGNGYYYIRSKAGNYFLDVYNGNTTNETNIQLYTLGRGNNQKWKLTSTSTEAQVKAHLDKIANGTLTYNSSTVLKVGATFTGYLANEQCKGYAKDVFYLCFKIWPGSTQSKPNNHLLNSTSGMTKVGSVTSMTTANIKSLFSKARPGDFVQMRRSSSGGSHSAIVYSVSSTGVTVLEANTDGKNTIKKSTYTWSQLCSKNAKMSVYTATNYKLK